MCNCQAAAEPAGIRVRFRANGRATDDFIYVAWAEQLDSKQIIRHVNNLYPDAKVKVVGVLTAKG